MLPLCATFEEIDLAVDALEKAITQVCRPGQLIQLIPNFNHDDPSLEENEFAFR